MVNRTGSWESCHVDSRVDHLFPPSLYIFVIGVGLPTNCLALWAAYRQVRQRNELGVYLMNLSVADLLYICTLPLWVDYFLHHDNWIHGPGSCKLFGFIFYSNIYISIAFLCCISVDRYLAVAHPLRFARLRRVKTAVAISSVVWATELGANSAPLFHDELFRDRYNHTFCFEKFPMESWVAWMNLYRVFVGFLFPWALMLLSYRGILRAVQNSVSTERQEKVKIKRLALSLIAIVLVCFAPYHVFLLCRSAVYLGRPGDCGFEERVFSAYHSSLAFTSLNCVADPILYCLVNEGARGDVAKALHNLLRFLTSEKPQEMATASLTLETPLTSKRSASKATQGDQVPLKVLLPPAQRGRGDVSERPLQSPPRPKRAQYVGSSVRTKTRTRARTAPTRAGRSRSEAPRPVRKVARARCDRQDGGGRVPHGEAALPRHPAGQQTAGQPHQRGRPPQRVLQDLHLPAAGPAVPLGGDADQDAHHGLPGHNHQAAERGGSRRAGRRAAGRGHHLPCGRRLPGPGVLAPPESAAQQGGGAARGLGRAAGRGGPPGAGRGGAAGADAGGARAERPGGAARRAAGRARPGPQRAPRSQEPGCIFQKLAGC